MNVDVYVQPMQILCPSLSLLGGEGGCENLFFVIVLIFLLKFGKKIHKHEVPTMATKKPNASLDLPLI